MPNDLLTHPSVNRTWAAFFALLLLLLSAGGFLYYQRNSESIRQDRLEDVRAVGKLKAGQIEQWRTERRSDARVLAAAPSLKAVAADPSARAEGLLEQLQAEKEAHGYSDISILRPDGTLLFSMGRGTDPVSTPTREAVAAALSGRRAVLSELYRAPGGNSVHIDAAAPVCDPAGRPLAAVVLRSDAGKFLYPLIQSWPVPSRSAETLLVRSEGGTMLFLNPLRHRLGKALSFRQPGAGDFPAAQAVLGKTGGFEGRDYRGVEVLADIRPVRESDWFLISKVDASELVGESRYHAGAITVLVGILSLLVLMGVAYGSRRLQADLVRRLFVLERAVRRAHEERSIILNSIGDGVIATDECGCVVFLNPVAEHLTGWKSGDACGKPLPEVFRVLHTRTRKPLTNPVEQVLETGRTAELPGEAFLLSRDGREYRIADSAAAIHDAGNGIVGAVLVFRDGAEEYGLRDPLETGRSTLPPSAAGFPRPVVAGAFREAAFSSAFARDAG